MGSGIHPYELISLHCFLAVNLTFQPHWVLGFPSSMSGGLLMFSASQGSPPTIGRRGSQTGASALPLLPYRLGALWT